MNEEKYVEMLENGELYDYITNLQQEIKEANDSITWWTNRFKAVERDNRKLKQENERLKEWKEDLLKENIELENIRKEAIEYIKYNDSDLYTYEPDYDYEENLVDNYEPSSFSEDLLNILQNGDDSQ